LTDCFKRSGRSGLGTDGFFPFFLNQPFFPLIYSFWSDIFEFFFRRVSLSDSFAAASLRDPAFLRTLEAFFFESVDTVIARTDTLRNFPTHSLVDFCIVFALFFSFRSKQASFAMDFPYFKEID